MNSEVVITGKSCVTSLGEGFNPWLNALLKGERIAPEINPDIFQKEIDSLQKGPHEMYRVQKIAAVTLLKAIEDAGVELNEKNADQVSILFGSTYGVEDFKAAFYKVFKDSEPELTSPAMFPYTTVNAISGSLSVLFGIKGTNITFSNGATSASEAIIAGCDLLAKGKTDIVIVSGTNFFCDDFDTELYGCGFEQECCAAIVMERKETAIASGRSIYAKIERISHSYGFYPDPDLEKRAVDCYIINTGYSFGGKETKPKCLKNGFSDAYAESLELIFGNTFSASGVLGLIYGIELFKDAGNLEEKHIIKPVKRILFENKDNYGSQVFTVITQNI